MLLKPEQYPFLAVGINPFLEIYPATDLIDKPRGGKNLQRQKYQFLQWNIEPACARPHKHYCREGNKQVGFNQQADEFHKPKLKRKSRVCTRLYYMFR